MNGGISNHAIELQYFKQKERISKCRSQQIWLSSSSGSRGAERYCAGEFCRGVSKSSWAPHSVRRRVQCLCGLTLSNSIIRVTLSGDLYPTLLAVI